MLFGGVAVYGYPVLAEHINGYLRRPVGMSEWLPQFSIIGLYDADVRLLPASWSLSTEIYYYLLIGLITGRSRRLALALFAVSIPVAALCALHVLPFDFYGHPVGNGFAFAFGSVTYFYRNAVTLGRGTFLVACLAYTMQTYGVPLLEDSDLDNANLATSLVPLAVIIVYLMRNNPVAPRGAQFLNMLGKLAYPMFLTHWTVCIFVSVLFFGGRAPLDAATVAEGWDLFLVTLAATLCLSALFYQFIDKPVEQIRRAVRPKA